MSFLKITDPTKRDQTVKEYLELKKNIRDNLLSERAGEQQLQTELTKFYRPITESQKAMTKEITESQKATAREITEGLRPIREGIENLQPIDDEEEEEEEETEATPQSLGDIAYNYLHGKEPYFHGIYLGKDGHYHMGKQKNKENEKVLTIAYNNIVVDGEKFRGTPGLWELIMEERPRKVTKDDLEEYKDLLRKTNALHKDFNPKSSYPRSSRSDKWKFLLRPIWREIRGYEGEGVVIMSSDPNALIERLDLLIASQKAGNTGVGNELVSISDELKRQGVLDTNAYKKLNSIIKNDST